MKKYILTLTKDERVSGRPFPVYNRVVGICRKAKYVGELFDIHLTLMDEYGQETKQGVIAQVEKIVDRVILFKLPMLERLK